MEQNRKIRVQPRMSAPMLGKYMVVGAHRRESILHDAKFPPTFKTVYYRLAEAAVRRALLRGADVAEHLAAGQQHILAVVAKSDFGRRANDVNADAVRRFAVVYPKLPRGASFLPVVRLSHVVFEGVTITVHPCVGIQRRVRNRVQRGALVVVFGKEHPLTETSGRAVAEILRLSLLAAGYTGICPELCIAADVAAGAYFTAPTSGRRVARDLASACREIADRWPLLRDGKVA